MPARVLLAVLLLSGALSACLVLALLDTRPARPGPVISLRDINDTIGAVTAYVRQQGELT